MDYRPEVIKHMLLKSLKDLGQTFVEIIRTRIEILSLDVNEARIRFVSILIISAFAFFFLAFGTIIAAFWLIAIFWESHRLLILGTLTAVFLGGGLIFLILLVWKLKKGPKFLKGTIDELKKDSAALSDRGRRSE
jgi:uncharacterized membrane protein YqjE